MPEMLMCHLLLLECSQKQDPLGPEPFFPVLGLWQEKKEKELPLHLREAAEAVRYTQGHREPRQHPTGPGTAVESRKGNVCCQCGRAHKPVHSF